MLIKDILHPSISSRQMVCPGIFFKKWTRKVAKRIHMQSPQNVRKITSEIFKQVPWRAIISCSITKFTPSTRLAWLKNPQLSDALASLAVMIVTDSLTDQNWRLAILHVWQFSHHRYSIQWECVVWPSLLIWSVWSPWSVWSSQSVWSLYAWFYNFHNLHFE